MEWEFSEHNDIDAIRKTAIAFMDIDPVPVSIIPGFIEHPFFSSAFMPDDGGKLVNIMDDAEAKERIITRWKRSLCNADLPKIFAMLQTKYHLVFFNYIAPYLDKKTFSEYLTYVWVASENPNQDVNVSLPEVVSWFRVADKATLMNAKELEYYNALPEKITVYRGVSVGRADKEGLSWTDKLDVAKWFAHRFDRGGKEGHILQGQVAKKDVLAYYNNRNEDELVCDSSKIYDVREALGLGASNNC